MGSSVEKTYADALFTLLVEESRSKSEFETVLAELNTVSLVMSGLPDFNKLLNTPTISEGEKLELLDSAFNGRVSEYVRNFLRLLTTNKRMSCFPQINKAFKMLYNEHFGIAEITVTSPFPLEEEQRVKIIAKMSQITGKSVSLSEKLDKSIIGGIVIDYGNTRYDGSVKTRLNELKKDIAGIIA
ncbi:MAG: ATP synthase F1 subunit delta [Oscillospiraceae bacterium]|nr:ATP synthase F1 subunit delta [Oscillospiraceae bacterium]